MHTEFVVEVNAKGQVVRVKSAKAYGDQDPFFNTQTNGNVLQMWIRHPDGSAEVGLYRVNYDYDPQDEKNQPPYRNSWCSRAAIGATRRAPPTVMMETAKREVTKKRAAKAATDAEQESAAARGHRWRDAVAHAPPIARRFRASSSLDPVADRARSCTGKDAYPSEEHARAFMLMRGVSLAVYRCRYCELWHLTSRRD